MTPDDVAINFEVADLPSSWDVGAISESLTDTPFHVGKVKRERYLPAGPLPVVDQSQAFIAGYTHDLSISYDGPLPVIVFGDHTRVLKFVDFQFACGADGTKVLIPDTRAFDPQFLYYALCAVDLPSRGYNRHFSVLREKAIPRPPLEEQRSIAHVLRTARRAQEATEQVIAAACELRRSLMRHVFTYGPVSVSAAPFVELGETEAGVHPKNWSQGTVGDLGKVITGATPSTAHAEYFGGPHPFFTPTEVNGTKWLTAASRTLTEEGLAQVRELPEGAVLITCIGNIGRVGISGVPRSASNQQINAVVPSRTNSEFIYYLMDWSRPRIEAIARSTTVPIVSKGNFKQLPVAVPPEDDQLEISSVLSAVDRRIVAEELRRHALVLLFSSLLHDLMVGKRRVSSDLVNHVAEATA